MKFKLQAIDSITTSDGPLPCITTIEFEEIALPEILEHVQRFLLGCGFQLANLDYDVPSS